MSTVVALLVSGVMLGVMSQTPPSKPLTDGELAAVRTQLEHGQYEEALRRATERLERGALLEQDEVELHRLAAVSAFNLKRKDEAERQFTSLLKIDPDYSLDPFVVPPPTVSFFDALRKKLDPSLQKMREERRERLGREEEERLAEQKLDAQRQRIDDLSREVALRSTYRPFWVNFLPFGAGQFQQHRNRLGISLAASQAALAATSLASFFIVEGLVKEQTLAVETEPGRTVDVTVKHVADADRGKLDTWKTVRLTTGIGFYALYLFGVIEAIGYHGRSVSPRVAGGEAPGEQPSLRVAPFAFGPSGAGATGGAGGGGVEVRSTF